jgi:Protein phosphatase 2C
VAGVTRVNGNLNLSRAIGDLKYKTNKDLAAADQIITAEPDVQVLCPPPSTPDQRCVCLVEPPWSALGLSS